MRLAEKSKKLGDGERKRESEDWKGKKRKERKGKTGRAFHVLDCQRGERMGLEHLYGVGTVLWRVGFVRGPCMQRRGEIHALTTWEALR